MPARAHSTERQKALSEIQGGSIWTPIVRREVWEAVQDKLHGKRPKKQVRHSVSLKGVVTCATCGNQVSWQLQKGRYYGACQRRDERCKNRKYKYIREDVVQEVVKRSLSAFYVHLRVF